MIPQRGHICEKEMLERDGRNERDEMEWRAEQNMRRNGRWRRKAKCEREKRIAMSWRWGIQAATLSIICAFAMNSIRLSVVGYSSSSSMDRASRKSSQKEIDQVITDD